MRSEDFPQELLRLLLSAAVGPFHLLDAVPTGHSALGKACWVNSKPRSQATLIQLVCLEGLRSRAGDPFCWWFSPVLLSSLSEQQPRAGRQKKLPIPMDVAVCKDNSCLLFSRVMLTQQSPHPADAFPYAQNCPTFVQPLDCISNPSSPISQPFLLS